MRRPVLLNPEDLRKVVTANGTNLTGRPRPLRRPAWACEAGAISLWSRFLLAAGVFFGQFDAVTWEE